MTTPEATARPVVVLVTDLFFSIKIGNELKAQGFTPTVARNAAQFARLLAEQQPVLGLIDIGASPDWATIAALRDDSVTATVPTLAFGPHKDVDGLRAAKAAGVTRVVSNSHLHADLTALVTRYARG